MIPINKKEFKFQEKKASENISKILNPNTSYKKKQKKILKDIFG